MSTLSPIDPTASTSLPSPTRSLEKIMSYDWNTIFAWIGFITVIAFVVSYIYSCWKARRMPYGKFDDMEEQPMPFQYYN